MDMTRRNLISTGAALAVGSAFVPLAVSAVKSESDVKPMLTLAQASLAVSLNKAKAGTFTGQDASETAGMLAMLFASFEQDGTAAKMQRHLTRGFVESFQVDNDFKAKLVASSRKSGANLEFEDLAPLDRVVAARLSLKVEDHFAAIVAGLREAATEVVGTSYHAVTVTGIRRIYFEPKCYLESITDAATLTAAIAIFFDPVVSAIFGLIAGIASIASRYWC